MRTLEDSSSLPSLTPLAPSEKPRAKMLHWESHENPHRKDLGIQAMQPARDVRLVDLEAHPSLAMPRVPVGLPVAMELEVRHQGLPVMLGLVHLVGSVPD